MNYNREFFEENVLILRIDSQLNKIINDFNFKSKGKLKNFPMIVYKDLNGISISEITEDNLNKLKKDKTFSKNIMGFM